VSAAWLAQPERGSATGIRFLTWLALNLGRRGTRWLLHPLALYFLLFSPGARRASRAYLDRALGRPARLRDVLRHYYTFASTLHDRVYFVSGRCDELDIAVEGAAAVDAILAEGRGCLLLGSHLGSFEALRALARFTTHYVVNVVMHEGNAEKTAGVLNRLAPELARRVIPPGRPQTMLRIKECLERGEIVGILADRPFGSEKTSLCPFLGVPARFPHGPFRLAIALETPVVLFFGLYQGGNRYRIALEALAAPPASGGRSDAVTRWVERYVARLEHYARQAPYNWFNFYDFWDEGWR
jgi:predicted LPLAT superfamily acyltransferase